MLQQCLSQARQPIQARIRQDPDDNVYSTGSCLRKPRDANVTTHLSWLRSCEDLVPPLVRQCSNQAWLFVKHRSTSRILPADCRTSGSVPWFFSVIESFLVTHVPHVTTALPIIYFHTPAPLGLNSLSDSLIRCANIFIRHRWRNSFLCAQ